MTPSDVDSQTTSPSLPVFPLKIRIKHIRSAVLQSLPIELRSKQDLIEAHVVKALNPADAYKISPSVGAFTARCVKCSKWRLLPSKKKFEEIREHLLEQPFDCEAAREWRPEISCNDDPDISSDGSKLWAIDRPNIARPPLGWVRLTNIRGNGGSRFADVYYFTRSGKRLRSMVDVKRYLREHPDEAKGVLLSQFSFSVPTPLDKNYVTKRTATEAFLEASGSHLVLALQHPVQVPQNRQRKWKSQGR